MPVAIVVGTPVSLIQRIKTGLKDGNGPYRAGWDVQYIRSRGKAPEVGKAETVKALDDAAHLGGAHIIGVSKQDDRKLVAAAIRPYFRFRWLENVLLNYIGSDVSQYFNGLNLVLAQEEKWAATVKPASSASPLLLPRSCFEAERAVREMWSDAESFGDDGVIQAAGKRLEEFSTHHWRTVPTEGSHRSRSHWVDASHRVFDHTGERHGTAPHPRGWKYSYAIPEGFHFDVTSLRGLPFDLDDPDGVRRSAGRGAHLNVDVHGYMR